MKRPRRHASADGAFFMVDPLIDLNRSRSVTSFLQALRPSRPRTQRGSRRGNGQGPMTIFSVSRHSFQKGGNGWNRQADSGVYIDTSNNDRPGHRNVQPRVQRKAVTPATFLGEFVTVLDAGRRRRRHGTYCSNLEQYCKRRFCHSPNNAPNSSSVRTVTPSFWALASLLPAFSPATT